LLAHELTHVVQQGGGQSEGRISRFADTDHNIIEEAALTLANMKPEDIEQVHEGNTKRDYSQSPAKLNLALLCDLNDYGGYKAHDHFDNFRWDEALQGFQPRSGSLGFGEKTPINHIDEELGKFVDALPDRGAFQHVGSAFHAIEDFFAHSNFVELSHGDFQHGRELITGSVGSSDNVSLLKILETISSLETAPYYGERANQEIAGSPAKSHARMAKDYKSNPYSMEAMVLAGLVIKELGMEILALQALPTKEERNKYVRDVIMAKVKRYLRPPSESDKWWETLRSAGGREMERSIREVAAKTPVTKNQCILSPLRSIEASRDSNFKLLGPAFPIATKYGHVWVQVGTGFSAPPAFAGPSGAVEPRSLDFLPVGAQLTGRF
jgi:Heterokaryon incompatibility protein Het-C